MTQTTMADIAISRVFDAPRELVYQAFTDPDQLAQWWGPVGCSLPRDTIEADTRAGGYQRFVMVVHDDPRLRIRNRITLTEVVPNELLVGQQEVDGVLPDGVEPFRVGLRIEFHDEPGGKTRLELRNGPLTEQFARAATQGWNESFTKLDALLAEG